MDLKFKITHEDPSSKGRLASFTTTHGVVQTPVFMPVGTQ
ncbi:MAG: tRNA guanosine(34) transglycosylase Tgt, partial [Nitrospinae bacterium]|nr:tRNA guanosine(34) transglycosylase Tgt [Nitrospinota bacterium]